MPKRVLAGLKALREAQFYSLQELADRAGVQRNTVRSLELGLKEPQGRTVRKLAQALGVEPEKLLEKPG